MANLLKETLDILKAHDKTKNDVLWVGNPEAYTTWDNFAQIANREYDKGFGCAEVASDLLVVGDNWWMERHEYDGSEWWEFKSVPTKPKQQSILKSVIGGMRLSLREMNSDDDE